MLMKYSIVVQCRSDMLMKYSMVVQCRSVYHL
jgi:hypothetical protein